MTADVTMQPNAVAGAGHRRPVLILVVCCLAQFMVTLDVSIVNVALPSIQTGLHFSPAGLSWVVNAYTVTFAGLLLLGGRAADLFGQRRVFLTGVGLFTVTSLIGGLATGAGMLVAARALQGVGAAVVAPATLTVLGATYTAPGRRARAFSVWGAVAGAGGAFGALAGGVLTDLLSWRWILFVNLPIGIAILAGGARWIAELRHTGTRQRLDVTGAALVTGGVSLLVYGIVSSENHGWIATPTLVGLAAGIVLLGLFVLHQARFAAAPIVALGIFRSRGLTTASVIAFLSGAGLFAMFYFVTLYLQQVLSYSPIRTGLAYLPLAVAIAVFARIAPALAGRIGPRMTLTAGMAGIAGGLAWLSQISAQSTFGADLLGPTIIIGAGQGLVMASTTIAGLAAVPPAQTGLASGILNATRQLGGVMGLAALAAIASGHTEHLLHARHPTSTPHAYAAGYGLAFAVAAGASLLGLTAAALFAGPPKATDGR